MTDNGLRALSRCSQLRLLDLFFCDQLTDAGVTLLAQCPRLQSLNVEQCPQVTETVANYLEEISICSLAVWRGGPPAQARDWRGEQRATLAKVATVQAQVGKRYALR